MLEVQSLDNTHHVSNDYANTYSGTQDGRMLGLQVPKAMQEYGSRIFDSRVGMFDGIRVEFCIHSAL